MLLQQFGTTTKMYQSGLHIHILKTNIVIAMKTGKSREKTDTPCPEAVVNSARRMEQNDVVDPRRENYGIRQACKKWQKQVFHFVLNEVTVNSFILYNLINKPAQISHGNMWLQYRNILVVWLIGDYLLLCLLWCYSPLSLILASLVILVHFCLS